MDLTPNPSSADLRIPRLSMRTAGVFTVVSVVAWFAADTLDIAFAVFNSLVFVVGIGLFLLGFWNGVQRSRVDEVTLTGLLALGSSFVPKEPRNLLWGAVAVETVVSILFASLRPFTQQAFGLLFPMLGVGFATLWGSRAASFHPRDDPRNPTPKPSGQH